MAGKREYEIAVYYFPNYHSDERNKMTHGDGWTEWELVKHARPRFPGHHQPKIPLWGYEDESDPEVMAKKSKLLLHMGFHPLSLIGIGMKTVPFYNVHWKRDS